MKHVWRLNRHLFNGVTRNVFFLVQNLLLADKKDSVIWELKPIDRHFFERFRAPVSFDTRFHVLFDALSPQKFDFAS